MRYKAYVNVVEKKINIENVNIVQGETVEIEFIFDKIVEGVDVSKEATCYVIYQINNLSGYVPIFAVDEKEGNDKVAYLWKVSKEITQNYGDLALTLRLDSLDVVILKTRPKTVSITKTLTADIPLQISTFGVDITPMAAEVEEEPITVSERTLVIPSRLNPIAVQNDIKSEAVKIVLPRYKQGKDLSTMRMYLKTISSGGRDDLDLTSTMTKTSNNITYNWILQPPQTSYSGQLQIQPRLEGTDFKLEFLASNVNIAQSIGADVEPVIPTNPSFVEQALQEIGTAMDSVRKGKEAAEAAATKAQNSAILSAQEAAKADEKLQAHDINGAAHMDIRQRVAVLDKNINTLQNTLSNVNVGHDAKQNVSGYTDVRLPKNAASGNMDVVVRGRTITNLLGKDGDFSYGNKWVAKQSKVTLNKDVLNIKNSGVNESYFYAAYQKPTDFIEKSNSYYLAHGEIMIKNNDKILRAYISPLGDNVFVEKGSAKVLNTDINLLNSFQKTGTKYKTSTEVSRVSYTVYSKVSEKSVLAEMEARNIMVTEITEDEYNNLSVAELIEKYPYVEDTKSVVASTRVRSGINKNLLKNSDDFDVTNINSNNSTSYPILKTNLTEGTRNFVRIKRDLSVSDKVSLSCFNLIPLSELVEDIKGKIIIISFDARCSVDTTASVKLSSYSPEVSYSEQYSEVALKTHWQRITSKPFKVPENITKGLRFLPYRCSIKGDPSDFYVDICRYKVEFGNIDTEWTRDTTPRVNGIYFAATESGEIAELKSLPNGIFDEIRKNSSGAYELVKRVGKHVLKNGDLKVFNNTSFNFIQVGIPKFSDCISFVNADDGRLVVVGRHLYPNVNLNTLPADTKYIGNCLTTASSQMLYFFFKKDEHIDLADANAKLAGTTIYYQLAEPKVIPLQASGAIHSLPSGTIYFEHSVADAGLYMANIEILYKDLPIKKLEKISKLDFTTGLETELDTTKAVIKADKLSFTHPDLTTGDIVSFIYEYNRQSANPQMIANFYDSRYVIADSKNGKFYQWEIGANNGVATINLTEV